MSRCAPSWTPLWNAYTMRRGEGALSVIAGVLFAAGVALLTIGSSQSGVLWLWYGALGGALSTLVTAGALFWVYSVQTNRYPFTGATRAWKWFYRDALPTQTSFDLPWYSYFRYGKSKQA